jgi:2-polyprenyl-3-methyl-5-hydroxy-6-metoxy-1,4-benzoquinol methylase
MNPSYEIPNDGHKNAGKTGLLENITSAVHPFFFAGLYLTSPNDGLIEQTKLYNKPFWIDRYLELKEFYGKNHSFFAKHYLKYGFPISRHYGESFAGSDFDEHFGPPEYSPDPDRLLEGYKSIDFYQNNKRALGHHQYDIAIQYRELPDIPPLDSINLLDYGCGIADPAVYLGSMGASATIVDLPTDTIEFADWRLTQREISHETRSPDNTEEPVHLPKNEYDLVILSEFLEHVRHPLQFLKATVDALKSGGVLYDSFGRHYTHNVEGSHLKEAKQAIEQAEYQQFYMNTLNHIRGDFYRKK